MRSSAPGWRLFVALELSPDLRRALADWTALHAAPGLRPLGTEALHVTLCFLGSVPATDWRAVAVAITPPPAGLVAATGRLRWLPARRPRVLAVELIDDDGELERFQAATAAALAAGGWYRAESRRYLPHVTLARVGRGAAAIPELPELSRHVVRPQSVGLIRSHLGQGPARYERLAGWPIR